MTVHTIQEQRRALKPKMDELRDKLTDSTKDFNADDKANFEKICKDFDDLGERMKLLSQLEERGKIDLDAEEGAFDQIGREDRSHKPETESRGSRLEVSEEARSEALAGWMSFQMTGEVTEAQRKACEKTGMSLNRRYLDIPLSSSSGVRDLQRPFRQLNERNAFNAAIESRAPLTTGTGSTGGYTIPTTLLRNLEVNMLAFGGMRQVAEIMRTSSGETINWPTANDTGNTGEMIGESTNLDNAGAGGVLPAFAQVTWSAYKFSSKSILVPFELLQDSIIDLPAVLGQMLGERLGRITNTKYTTGTGSSQPNGLITAAAVGKTTASPTAVTYSELIALEHSVDPAYRANAGYMGHDSIKLAFRLLLDSNNRPLWVDGVDLNKPDTLGGRAFTTNQDMSSSLAATNKVLAFGQFNRYKIRSVGSLRLYRLQELYRAADQDGFIALIREDGNLLNAGTNPIKLMQMHA